MANNSNRQNMEPNKSGDQSQQRGSGKDIGRAQMGDSDRAKQGGRENTGDVSSDRPTNIKGGDFSGSGRSSGRSSSGSSGSSSLGNMGGGSRSDLSSGGQGVGGKNQNQQTDQGKSGSQRGGQGGDKGKANLQGPNLGGQDRGSRSR